MKVTKLDKVFSIYIRKRDSNESGIGKCCSCGKYVHWKDVDCGHFVNRKHMSLRFSEINCNMQCRSCNRFDEGNIVGYTKFMINKYGIDILDKLEIAKKQTIKFTHFEINELAKYYKTKTK